MERYDTVIVGGGPIGGSIANRMAKEGYKTAIIEEHKKIGFPLKCAGLITSRVFDYLEIPKKKVFQNEIFGAKIYSPSKNKLTRIMYTNQLVKIQ